MTLVREAPTRNLAAAGELLHNRSADVIKTLTIDSGCVQFTHSMCVHRSLVVQLELLLVADSQCGFCVRVTPCYHDHHTRTGSTQLAL
jgi:hypothetical protein